LAAALEFPTPAKDEFVEARLSMLSPYIRARIKLGVLKIGVV
jgi:hypothetical protein